MAPKKTATESIFTYLLNSQQEYMPWKTDVEAAVKTGAKSKAALKTGARKPKSVTTWGTSLPAPKSWIVASAKVMVLGEMTAARSKQSHLPVYVNQSAFTVLSIC